MHFKREGNSFEISLGGLPYTIFCCATAMIGYHIHHSIGWAIVDWILAPFAWVKWLICHQVNMTIIKGTFDFFLK